MTCKDCLHIEVCAYIKPDLPVCADFADRSRYVVREKGEWVWSEENECWVCSKCELSALNNYRGNSTASDFCPHCGSDMRKGENE